MSGGTIALGHPIAASGLRLVLRALTSLKQHQNKNALVSLCIGGGQGGAAWVEAC
jgi:acetyl-CoA C-acetyltransferase/acetyl-CoA acyltransferase